MENIFEEFIAKRCEEVLLKSEEFITVQKKLAESYEKNDIDSYSELSLKAQAISESISYKTAIRDTIKFLINTK